MAQRAVWRGAFDAVNLPAAPHVGRLREPLTPDVDAVAAVGMFQALGPAPEALL